MSIGFPSKEVYEAHVDSPKLRDFLTNVFQQVDADRFMNIYREAVQEHSSRDIYETLLTRASEAKGGVFSQIRMGLNALKNERNTLADNVAKVMDPNQARDGYVEIAMPGRMIKTLKPKMGLSGRITVVSESESRVQSGLIHPYQDFHTLTYDPLPLKERSVDVISCFPGLHHCPEDKLDAFIKSIYQTLQNGGIFLLRDHDAHNQEMHDLAVVIHSVFNAATGVSIADEECEVRNFKGLNEWKTLLEENGFRCVSDSHIREGDSTENALLKFVKVGDDDHAQMNVIREKLISAKNNYTRPKEQTHLTTVEWFNVESSQNLGNYENFWDYPYFSDVKQLGKCYLSSWKSALKVQKFKKILTSDHNLMNSTIVALMGTEYIAKGILYSPLKALAKLGNLLPKKQDAVWEEPAKNYQRWQKDYGKRLEVTPYYAQKYVPHIKSYWKNFANAFKKTRITRSFTSLLFDRQTIKNVVVGVAMTADLLFRACISTPINLFYGGEENGDDREIGLIVEGEVENAIEEEGNPYKGLIVPRYKELEELLKDLTSRGVKIKEIAGQNRLQMDVIVENTCDTFGEEKLYERRYLPDSNQKIVALNVAVDDLGHYLNNYQLHRVYDF